MKCQIQWIDSNGRPTPDDNEAIGQVVNLAHDYIIQGRKIHFDESKPYFICEKHASRLNDPDMADWKFV